MHQDAYALPLTKVHDASGGVGPMTGSIATSLRKILPWVLLLAIMAVVGIGGARVLGV